MNKPFLLIAGYNFYPCAGTDYSQKLVDNWLQIQYGSL